MFVSRCLISLFLLVYLGNASAYDRSRAMPIRPGEFSPELPEYVDDIATPTVLPHTSPPVSSSQVDSDTSFILRTLDFKGNQLFSNGELQQQVAEYLGKKLTISELENIGFQLTRFYIDQGFINSGVMLENQHIRNGLVYFWVIEGHLSDINICGAGHLQPAYIQNRLQLRSDEPLQQEILQQRFQLLLIDPLIERLNGVLRPGINAGESILDLEVTRAQPYGLDIYFDNYTPPSIGAYSGRINGYVHNLTGLGDIANLNLQFTEGNRGLDLAYQIPLTASDTRIHFRYQLGKAKVIENNLERFDISSDFFTLESTISHPLYRSLNRFFSVEAQFAYRQIETSLGDRGVGFGFGLGDGVDGKTSVSVIRLIQNYSDRSSQSVFSFRSTFNIGLDVFSATVNSGSLPDSQFFSWIGQFRYGYKLADNGSQLLLRGDVQLAANHLLSLEQFALGGAYTIRGYRENYRVRDQAYVVSAELLYPLIQKTKKIDLALQIAPFVDVGSAWNYNQPNEATLLSVGIGLRSQWDWAELDFYWAHPITSPDQFADYDLQDDGIHFQLTAHVL